MSPKKRAGRRPPPRKGATPPRSAGTPPPSGGATPFYTPGSSSLRRSVERASAPALVLLTQLPRLVVTLLPLALLLLGFFLPLAIGLVFLAIFLLFTGWLAYLSWPRTDGRARLLRFAIFALVIALIVIRIARA